MTDLRIIRLRIVALAEKLEDTVLWNRFVVGRVRVADPVHPADLAAAMRLIDDTSEALFRVAVGIDRGTMMPEEIHRRLVTLAEVLQRMQHRLDAHDARLGSELAIARRTIYHASSVLSRIASKVDMTPVNAS